ncbi:hypothetical protein [Acidocella facilis]|uniref:hypothetical protein n=1 Tax=Acidocella facilis TaxID=525 RepID=UPI001F3EF143|nr:hypothetical protein [Acidocella facilis]
MAAGLWEFSGVLASEVTLITAGFSVISAVLAAVLTYVFTERRERNAEWRKLKLEQYKEFILALSSTVSGRENREAHFRYADAVNAMSLVASRDVLQALGAFQTEISFLNNQRSGEKHDILLNSLIKAMREDIGASGASLPSEISLKLLAPPPA